MALAREAAPHIRKQGEKILPKSMKDPSSDGKSKMDGVIEVAASGLKGMHSVTNLVLLRLREFSKNIMSIMT